MQNILDKQKLSLIEDHPDDSQSRTQSKIITRKQDRRLNDHFKKKQSNHDARDKRYHSSHQLKFVKSHSSTGQKDHGKMLCNIEECLPAKENDSNCNSPIKESPKKSLVFNKFTHKDKQEIRQVLNALRGSCISEDGLRESYQQIEKYIIGLEQNNAKLLEVNYFFQKEFNHLMADRQQAKKVQKCSKNYCLQCRYHLQKQNQWKQQKNQLQSQIALLKQELSLQSSGVQSIQTPSIEQESVSEGSDIVRLREQLQEKDEEYMILLKEFNYLDGINKDLKSRMAQLMEDYKYLAIQNRTLLTLKSKLIQKQIDCTKFKDQRDYFKRKIIDLHKRHEQQRLNGHHIPHEQSIFSLSSASNDLTCADVDHF